MTSDTGWFGHLLSSRPKCPRAASGLPIYQLHRDNITLPTAIQENWGTQSDAEVVLTFCWNQRMASSLRMRWLKPIRPVFRFLSAMLKPGLPRTWTRKQCREPFIKAYGYTTPVICANQLKNNGKLWHKPVSIKQLLILSVRNKQAAQTTAEAKHLALGFHRDFPIPVHRSTMSSKF